MSALFRTVLGIVSVGAGIVSIGLSSSLALPTLFLMALLGLLQIAYGIHALLGGRLRGYLGLAVALAPSALSVLLLTVQGFRGPDVSLAVAIAAGLNIIMALLVGAALRFRWPYRQPGSAWALLGAAALAAGVVGFSATPALAATEAGDHAMSHGGMMGMSMEMGHAGMDHTR
jgi:hypothetical protein